MSLGKSQDTSTYWIIAIPNNASSSNNKVPSSEEDWAQQATLTRRALDKKTQKYCDLHAFNIPKLRVGTLDSLMTLSDELGKIDQYIEATVKKTAKTYTELKGSETLVVDGETAEHYIESFKWNLAKYPTGAHLSHLAKSIESYVTSSDEDLRKKVNKYLEINQALSNIERKSMGTLLVKSLKGIVKEDDLIEREYLTSVLIVLPKQKEEYFLQRYELLEDKVSKKEEDTSDDINEEKKVTTFKSVVPRSAKKLTEDSDFVLYRVIVFKKGVDSYRNLCRAERWTVRNFSHEKQSADDEKAKLNSLTAEKNKVLGSLILWCETNYSEIFAGWMHLKAIRIFVESVLRFGIPVNFLSVVLKPRKGFRTKLEKVLDEMYSHLAGANNAAHNEDRDVFSGVDSEFYPYVYLGINLGDVHE